MEWPFSLIHPPPSDIMVSILTNVTYYLQNAQFTNLYLSANSLANFTVGDVLNSTSTWSFQWNSGPLGVGGNWSIIHQESCKTFFPSESEQALEWDIWNVTTPTGLQISYPQTELNLAFHSSSPKTQAVLMPASQLPHFAQMVWLFTSTGLGPSCSSVPE